MLREQDSRLAWPFQSDYVVQSNDICKDQDHFH